MHVPSRNTGRGVHGCGEPKGIEARKRRKTEMHAASLAGEVLGLKGPEVAAVITRNRAI